MKEQTMGQKPDIFGHEVSRRRFLQLIEIVLKSGSGVMTLELGRKLLPQEDDFGFIENIPSETRRRLLLYHPKTVAHRGGNSIGHLELSKQAGVDFVEVDIKRYLGSSLITHGEKWPVVAYVRARKLFGLSGPIPNVSEISQGL